MKTLIFTLLFSTVAWGQYLPKPQSKPNPKLINCHKTVAELNEQYGTSHNVYSFCSDRFNLAQISSNESGIKACLGTLIPLISDSRLALNECLSPSVRKELAKKDLPQCLIQTKPYDLYQDQVKFCMDKRRRGLLTDKTFISCTDIYQQGYPESGAAEQFKYCSDQKNLTMISGKGFSQCTEELSVMQVSLSSRISYCLDASHQSQEHIDQLKLCEKNLESVVSRPISLCMKLDKVLNIVTPQTAVCLKKSMAFLDETYLDDETPRSVKNLITDFLHDCQNEKRPAPKKDGPLSYVGMKVLSERKKVENTLVGGLSGLVWDPKTSLLHVVSDDPGFRNSSRIYNFELDLMKGVHLKAQSVTTINTVVSSKESRGIYDIDAEGITLLKDGSFIVSSETLLKNSQSFLRVYDHNGEQLQEISFSEKFLPKSGQVERIQERRTIFQGPWRPNPSPVQTEKVYRFEQIRGVLPNKAFESLTSVRGKDIIFTANESPLAQDGINNKKIVRIIRIKRDSDKLLKADAEFAYELENAHDNGLVDMVALNENKILTLERRYDSVQRKVTAKIFEVSLIKAKNYIDIDSLEEENKKSPIKTVTKKLLMDLDDVLDFLPKGLDKIDNFEGIALGPTLPNGNHSILLVTDNNFSGTQLTQFLFLDYDQNKD